MFAGGTMTLFIGGPSDKKSCLRETPNLLTCSDSRFDTEKLKPKKIHIFVTCHKQVTYRLPCLTYFLLSASELHCLAYLSVGFAQNSRLYCLCQLVLQHLCRSFLTQLDQYVQIKTENLKGWRCEEWDLNGSSLHSRDDETDWKKLPSHQKFELNFTSLYILAHYLYFYTSLHILQCTTVQCTTVLLLSVINPNISVGSWEIPIGNSQVSYKGLQICIEELLQNMYWISSAAENIIMEVP